MQKPSPAEHLFPNEGTEEPAAGRGGRTAAHCSAVEDGLASDWGKGRRMEYGGPPHTLASALCDPRAGLRVLSPSGDGESSWVLQNKA